MATKRNVHEATEHLPVKKRVETKEPTREEQAKALRVPAWDGTPTPRSKRPRSARAL